jgi:hypothetical protein
MARVVKVGQALIFLAGFTLLTASAHAGEKIWAALFVGENRPVLGPQAPPPLTARLREVFGFTHYKLLKDETVDLARSSDHWVLSRKDFFLRLQLLPNPANGPTRLRYEIYKDGYFIATGVYAVTTDTPLFISGPDFHHGRLIFVLQPR